MKGSNKQSLGGILLLACLIFILLSCSEEDKKTPKTCDFSNKLVSIAIDEQPILLFSDLEVDKTIEDLQEELRLEELQAEQLGNLTHEAQVYEDGLFHDPLSDRGKIALVKIDLLQKLKAASETLLRETYHTLYNHLRWAEQITDRAYLQNCNTRVTLKSETSPYQSHPIESHFLKENISEFSKRNLYHAFESKTEIDYLNAYQNTFTYLQPKTGRGFSTGFFVRDSKGREWKVKVGWEAYREPLATRLAWGMGFHVDETFHIRDLFVNFSAHSGAAGSLDELEKLFEEKGRKLEDSLAGILLNDATVIDFINTPSYQPNVSELYEIHRGNINAVIFKSVVLERRDFNIVRVGQWAFDALNNPDLRAVRMLGLLNLWLGNPDIKFDNNRIFFKCVSPVYDGSDLFKSCVETGKYEYQFVVHDLGLAFAALPSEVNDIVHELNMQREDDGTVSIKIDTRERDIYAWQNITLQDAEAFAERLAQLSEQQIQQAVAASGYPYPAYLLMVEQLKFRRNQFLEILFPGQYPLFETDLSISNESSGSINVDGQSVLIPQDDFILSEGQFTNDISRGLHGRHSEMIRD